MKKGIDQTPENWKKIVRPYMKADDRKSWIQFSVTLGLYLASWFFACSFIQESYAITLLFSLLAAGLYVRLFIIMHDCGHGNYFTSAKTRNLVGHICGWICFTPSLQWSRDHAIHHNTSGNLTKRGFGDVWTVTSREYQEMSALQKIQYRIYRNPLMILFIGPAYLFLLEFRFFRKIDRPAEKRSVIYTNLFIVMWSISISSFIGFENFLLIQIPIALMAQSTGVFLFYVQHQYEHAYWKEQEEWDYFTACIKGSSYLELPKVLQWFSGNIGFHHIHHLSHLIPNYHLEKCYRENELFQNPPVKLTLSSALHCLSLHIYDEDKEDLISFREFKSRQERAPLKMKTRTA